MIPEDETMFDYHYLIVIGVSKAVFITFLRIGIILIILSKKSIA
jgi:hypothetical protein